VGGIKAELVARLLRELRLGDRPAPAHVPARLVLRAYLERARWTRDLDTLTRPMEEALARAFRTLKYGRDPRVTGNAASAGRATRLSDLQVALCDAFPVTEGGGDTHGRQLLRAARQHEREEALRKQKDAEQRRQQKVQRRLEEVQRRQEAEQRRQEEEQRRLEFVCCVQCCHNGSAKDCPHRMCGYCCKGCIRHRRNRPLN
jgi:predicted ribosome quality control (RQC) complex YloA/Tae2 family protein